MSYFSYLTKTTSHKALQIFFLFLLFVSIIINIPFALAKKPRPTPSPSPRPTAFPSVTSSPRATQTPIPTLSPTPTSSVSGTLPIISSLSGIHVVGNKLRNSLGNEVKLIGVNRSGTEYACISWGFSDGPTDQASLTAIKAWNLNTIRIPLNQSCWLGTSDTFLGGIAYQQNVINYVNLITQNGMVAILDLHWNAPGTVRATGQQPMADADHSPTFWAEVANTFKGNDKVIFDIFNEPDPIQYRNDYPGGFSVWQTDTFKCLRDGCEVTASDGTKYQGAGTQFLVNTIRQTGAKNIIMIGGIQMAQTITQYVGTATSVPSGFMPIDPLNNLAVSQHQYAAGACSDESCWNGTVLPVAQKYPIITGEFGDTDCTDNYTKTLLPWLDRAQISYVGWTWDSWDSCQALIKDYTGIPSLPYGAAYKNHLSL